MESRSYKRTLPSELIKQQMEILNSIVDKAQERVDYEAAHDKEILTAISIVEGFLRQKKRICYGGQAINAYLPVKHKFYKPETSIPDYDFLTPSSKADIELLVKKLKVVGFTEIGVREGMHEGTTKLYVNYVAVADVTEINPYFYKKLAERAERIAGITYLDPNTLRMMMYLELSRPRGEIGRWPKVFERLMLLNKYVPIKNCVSHIKVEKKRIPYGIRKEIINYIIAEKRVLAGAEISSYYKLRLHGDRKVEWFFEQKNPVIFYSPDIDRDVDVLLAKLGDGFKVKSFKQEADFFPPVKVVLWRKRPVFAVIQETACHSYNALSMGDGRSLHIASIDTLITLLLSLTFRKQLEKYMEMPVLCIVSELVELASLYRKGDKTQAFPFISIECSGYQKQLPTLLKEKVGRMKKNKNTTITRLNGNKRKTQRHLRK
jgi:hypothetical protein